MTNYVEPRSESEWSRRAIINVAGVLAAHVQSLTLIGAHAVLLRTAALDAPLAPTSDGDLDVTPGLVGDAPSIEALLVKARLRRTAPRHVRACGAAHRIKTASATRRSARRSTCSPRTGCPARPVAASGVCLLPRRGTESLLSETPSGWNSQYSTGPS